VMKLLHLFLLLNNQHILLKIFWDKEEL